MDREGKMTGLIFGVHNWYHNGGSLGDTIDYDVQGMWVPAEIPVKISQNNVVVFNLHEHLRVEQKLELARALNEFLKAEFGTKLSFATTQRCDCFRAHEQPAYFDGIKAMDPAITTIYFDYEMPEGGFHSDKWDPTGPSVDYKLPQKDPANKLLDIVNPAGDGMQFSSRNEPAEGWDAFRAKLKRAYNDALYKIEPRLAKSPEEYERRERVEANWRAMRSGDISQIRAALNMMS